MSAKFDAFVRGLCESAPTNLHLQPLPAPPERMPFSDRGTLHKLPDNRRMEVENALGWAPRTPGFVELSLVPRCGLPKDQNPLDYPVERFVTLNGERWGIDFDRQAQGAIYTVDRATAVKHREADLRHLHVAGDGESDHLVGHVVTADDIASGMPHEKSILIEATRYALLRPIWPTIQKLMAGEQCPTGFEDKSPPPLSPKR